MITQLIVLLDIVGLRVIDAVRSVPKTVTALFATVMLVLVAQPAQAATTVQASSADGIVGYLGCPTLAWAEPLRGTSQDITGMLFGFAIIAFLIVVLIAGLALLFARNRRDKAEGAIETAKNSGAGIGIILVVLPIAALVIWGVATALNPNC